MEKFIYIDRNPVSPHVFSIEADPLALKTEIIKAYPQEDWQEVLDFCLSERDPDLLNCIYDLIKEGVAYQELPKMLEFLKTKSVLKVEVVNENVFITSTDKNTIVERA